MHRALLVDSDLISSMDHLYSNMYDDDPRSARLSMLYKEELLVEENQHSSRKKRKINDSAMFSSGTKKLSFAEAWDSMFERLKVYKEEHGDYMVPWNYEKDPKLGSWVSKQRHYHSNGVLPQKRVESLQKLGFTWDVTKKTWYIMFSQLSKYKEEHGDCMVPIHYKENPKLGRWVYVQRNKGRRMPHDHFELLDSLGFKWSVHKAFWKEDCSDGAEGKK